MKYITHLLYIPLCFCMAIFLQGCSDSGETEPTSLESEGLFTISSLTFEGIAASQSQVVTFHAPAPWTAELHGVGSWVRADVLHGEAGDAGINLSPRSDNFNTSMREAQLEIYIDGYKPYTITLFQKSAATGDIQVEGLSENGILQLTADETGLEFRDTLWVNSNKRWTLSSDEQEGAVLAFEIDGSPRNGEETRIQMIVKAVYAKFQGTTYTGRFYITTDDGSAVPVEVHAAARVQVYDTDQEQSSEAEKVSFNLVNSVQNGIFMTDCYVQSNIRWTLGEIPAWVETSTEVNSVTNVLFSGKIDQRRHHITFHVKESALSRDGKSGNVTLLDARGQILKTFYLTFSGVGSNYIDSRLSFPALDPQGNSFGFEAKASLVNPDSPTDYWKAVSREFDVITSMDYTSLADAPFHLLLVSADNGMPKRQEAHWAYLQYVGQKTDVSIPGLYCHRLSICANDRGDADDCNGISNETFWRHAMVIIAPRSVVFQDLWDENGMLKEKYTNTAVLIAQKNNADADYVFGFEEIGDGQTASVPAAGGRLTYTITPGSYTQCDVLVQQQNASGDWVGVDSKVCQMEINVDEHQQPHSITFIIGRNKGEENPFTHVVVGAPRHLRVSVQAFLGDAEGSRTIFTFYINQDLEK